jgi:hypothetical protein
MRLHNEDESPEPYCDNTSRRDTFYDRFYDDEQERIRNYLYGPGRDKENPKPSDVLPKSDPG